MVRGLTNRILCLYFVESKSKIYSPEGKQNFPLRVTKRGAPSNSSRGEERVEIYFWSNLRIYELNWITGKILCLV